MRSLATFRLFSVNTCNVIHRTPRHFHFIWSFIVFYRNFNLYIAQTRFFSTAFMLDLECFERRRLDTLSQAHSTYFYADRRDVCYRIINLNTVAFVEPSLVVLYYGPQVEYSRSKLLTSQ